MADLTSRSDAFSEGRVTRSELPRNFLKQVLVDTWNDENPRVMKVVVAEGFSLRKRVVAGAIGHNVVLEFGPSALAPTMAPTERGHKRQSGDRTSCGFGYRFKIETRDESDSIGYSGRVVNVE